MTAVIKTGDRGASERTASVLNAGGVIVYPTETLYGIGGLVSSEKAVERIYEIKGRPYGKPIPLLVRDMDMLERVAEINDCALSLSRKFWPGPLTLVLKEKGRLPALITADTGKVGVRVSSNDFVKHLFNYIDSPLCSTSANISGEENLLSVDYIYSTFKDKVDLILDSGNIPPSKGSTIIDTTVSPLELIREGDVTARELEEFLQCQLYADSKE